MLSPLRSFEIKAAALSLCHSLPPLCGLAGAALERNLHNPAASSPWAAEASARPGPGPRTQLPGPAVGGDSAPQPPGNRSSRMCLGSRGDLGHTRRPLTALPSAACSPPRQGRTVAEAVSGRTRSSAPRPHVPRGGAACGERREHDGKKLGRTAGRAPGRERSHHPPEPALTRHSATPRSAIGAYRARLSANRGVLGSWEGAVQAGRCSPRAVAQGHAPRAAPFVLDFFSPPKTVTARS